MSGVITREAWLAEVDRVLKARPADDPGMTVQEMADASGCCSKTMQAKLRTVKHRIVRGYRTIENLAGKKVRVPVYRILPE